MDLRGHDSFRLIYGAPPQQPGRRTRQNVVVQGAENLSERDAAVGDARLVSDDDYGLGLTEAQLPERMEPVPTQDYLNRFEDWAYDKSAELLRGFRPSRAEAGLHPAEREADPSLSEGLPGLMNTILPPWSAAGGVAEPVLDLIMDTGLDLSALDTERAEAGEAGEEEIPPTPLAQRAAQSAGNPAAKAANAAKAVSWEDQLPSYTGETALPEAPAFDEAAFDKRARSNALIAAGLGMLGNSLDPMGQIGAGGLAGLASYDREMGRGRNEQRQARQDQLAEWGLRQQMAGQQYQRELGELQLRHQMEQARRQAAKAREPKFEVEYLMMVRDRFRDNFLAQNIPYDEAERMADAKVAEVAAWGKPDPMAGLTEAALDPAAAYRAALQSQGQ